MIIGQRTQSEYVSALSIMPAEWEAIAVSVAEAAVAMQLYALDRSGSPARGEWGDEIVVEPGTLSLSRVAGVRFRTNPATPGLAGTVTAFAWTADDPIVAGLQPQSSLPAVFGPTLYDGSNTIPNGAQLQTIFDRSIPGHWGSVLLTFTQTGGVNHHYRAEWLRGTTAIVNFDFYTGPNANPKIAIPINGDRLALSTRHDDVGPVDLFTRAFLTNVAPFSVWERSEWTLLHINSDSIPALGSSEWTLPLFAGTVELVVFLQGGGPVHVTFTGRDHNGVRLSHPLVMVNAPADSFRETAVLPPHRNSLLIENTHATVATSASLTVIGERR